MKTNEVVFILDRSGSMCDLVSDTIGGFNSILKEQKDNKQDGEVLISTVLFNERSKVIYDREKVDNVSKMTNKEYVPSGSTALIDALGDSIKHIKSVHKYIREEDIPDHTLFVIITDGLENASHKYSSDEVKKMIKEQQDNSKWEFMFVGANIDAVETAKNYGIDSDYAFDYISDGIGTHKLYGCLNEKITSTRKCGKMMKASNKCMSKISEDYKSRKKK